MNSYTERVGLFLISVSLLTTLGSSAFMAYVGISDRMNDTLEPISVLKAR